MIRLLVQMLVLIGTIAATVGMAGWGLHLWRTPISLEGSMTAPPPKRVAREIPDPENPALAAFSQSMTRPLFFEGRRLPTLEPKQVKTEPPKPAPPPPPPPPPKPVALPDKIKLLGVVILSAERQALVDTPPQPARWFKVGDKIGEWTIARIEENSIVLNHSARSATLPLYSDAASK